MPAILYVQRSVEQCLDDRLSTHVEPGCPLVKPLQHTFSQIQIHPVKRLDHRKFVCKVSGDIFATGCFFSNFVSRNSCF